ncbi:hypothetical protein HK098_000379 [Nowakowskiella sp. JEL0407]|nr:hypothetical protein HK098_000379 [Nowakowskiella sp. JEL0407]
MLSSKVPETFVSNVIEFYNTKTGSEKLLNRYQSAYEWLESRLKNSNYAPFRVKYVDINDTQVVHLWRVSTGVWETFEVGFGHAPAYVAISHVWNDSRLGFNGNWENETERLLEIYARMFDAATLVGVDLVWFDSCSVNQSDNFAIRDATYAMSFVYAYATATVALVCDLGDADRRPMWMNKIWTLQEATYTRKLYVMRIDAERSVSPTSFHDRWMLVLEKLSAKVVPKEYILEELKHRTGGWHLDGVYAVRHLVGGLKNIPCTYDLSIDSLMRKLLARSAGDDAVGLIATQLRTHSTATSTALKWELVKSSAPKVKTSPLYHPSNVVGNFPIKFLGSGHFSVPQGYRFISRKEEAKIRDAISKFGLLEKHFAAELGYDLEAASLHANLSAKVEEAGLFMRAAESASIAGFTSDETRELLIQAMSTGEILRFRTLLPLQLRLSKGGSLVNAIDQCIVALHRMQKAGMNELGICELAVFHCLREKKQDLIEAILSNDYFAEYNWVKIYVNLLAERTSDVATIVTAGEHDVCTLIDCEDTVLFIPRASGSDSDLIMIIEEIESEPGLYGIKDIQETTEENILLTKYLWGNTQVHHQFFAHITEPHWYIIA